MPPLTSIDKIKVGVVKSYATPTFYKPKPVFRVTVWEKFKKGKSKFDDFESFLLLTANIIKIMEHKHLEQVYQ